MWPGPRPTSVPSGILTHPSVWPQQTWDEKMGAAVFLFWGGEGAGYPSDTISPELRPTSVPSGIHPTVWPQYTNITDRQDNGPIAKGKPLHKWSPKNCRQKPLSQYLGGCVYREATDSSTTETEIHKKISKI